MVISVLMYVNSEAKVATQKLLILTEKGAKLIIHFEKSGMKI